MPYLLAAFWAGNEGSLLLWLWLLSLFAFIVLIQNRHKFKGLMPDAISITMLINAFFLILIIHGSNPFERLPFTPPDGMGLNPLLEHPLMIFHPPTLLAGYPSFTIPFAFAIAALITKRLGAEWVKTVRNWVLISWFFLGAGNLLGAWWAYVVLGWGGYWAWDPVENAGLMPWLVSTALLHSLIVQRRRGMFKVWNITLIIITFALTIFGTFLTRSGILPSVHAFAESYLGPAFLSFIGVILIGSFGLLIYRLPYLRDEGKIDSWLSRGATLLLNNLLLLAATFAIFIGTIFPLISEAILGVKASVTISYFNRVASPIFLALIVALGVGTRVGWRRTSIRELGQKLFHPFSIAGALSIVLVMLGVRNWYALIGFFCCAFVITSILSEWFVEIRKRVQARKVNYPKAFFSLLAANKPHYGAYIIHLGVILIAIGVIGSSSFNTEKEICLTRGETASINQYVLRYDGKVVRHFPDKTVVSANLSIFTDNKLIGTLTSEKRFYKRFEQSVTEVAVRTTLKEDLYVILAGWTKDTATFKVLLNPLVVWLWIGGAILLLGTVIALLPHRWETASDTKVSERNERATTG